MDADTQCFKERTSDRFFYTAFFIVSRSDHLKIFKNGLRRNWYTGAIRRMILRRIRYRNSFSWDSTFTNFPLPPGSHHADCRGPCVVPGTHTSELDKGGNMAAVCPQIKTESTNKHALNTIIIHIRENLLTLSVCL